MKLCKCGQPVHSRYGRLCTACLFSVRSAAGKSNASRINYAKREKAKQAERRTATTQVPCYCKCPTCHCLHVVPLAPSQIEEGKIPRLYCPLHEGRRNMSEAYTGGRAV